MKVKIIHHNDADGYVSAYIAYKNYKDKYKDIEFIEMDYSKKLTLENFTNQDIIIIVDFSIEPKEMIDLLKITKNVIWIDHHITAIEKYNDWYDLIKEATGVEEIEGLRFNGLAGCELTWLYFTNRYTNSKEINYDEALYELELAPLYIQLTGDWDVWRHNIEYTKPFMIALSNILSMDVIEKLDEDAYSMVELDVLKNKGINQKVPALKIDLDEMTYLKELIDTGNKYIDYRNHWSSQFRDRYGFSSDLLGPNGEHYNIYCMNIGNANSEFFGNKIDEYDAVVSMCFNGKDWNYSMYSNKDNVECGTLCRYLGVDNGGGHKGAAGFRHNDLLFRANLTSEDEK